MDASPATAKGTKARKMAESTRIKVLISIDLLAVRLVRLVLQSEMILLGGYFCILPKPEAKLKGKCTPAQGLANTCRRGCPAFSHASRRPRKYREAIRVGVATDLCSVL